MITDCHARFTYPDGKTEDITAKAGDGWHFPAFSHLPGNLSGKPSEVIGVVLKSRAFSALFFGLGRQIMSGAPLFGVFRRGQAGRNWPIRR
jgi:hypothetical protein